MDASVLSVRNRRGNRRSHYFFRSMAVYNGAPQVPIANRLPNSTTASMLSRPSRDQVVDVASTHGDVLKGPDVMLNGSNQQPDRQESDEEADRCQEHPAVRAVGDVLPDDIPELGEVQQ
jgi:hypothetical protein